ncbi:MAG: glutamate--tRNA ligase [Bacteroidales bacterium]|nr:glutamate--tRNA ligase [Bacteroidales bacterium]MBQ6101213.1 glutamate--tRNA ligase [Bacteroidales bacterium]
MTVRTRFAPSPTGYMHIGNLRTALYAYLFAKSQHGKFVLRIEDTDQKRYVEDATRVIYETLETANIHHDEGPDVGGDYGPYVQSQRKAIYKEYAMKLIEKGAAYYCFCAKTEEDAAEDEEPKENPFESICHCRDLSAEEVQKNLAEGKPYVIRQKVPHEGTTTFNDLVYGEITVENETLDDQILLKSDGMPTYNFANVVDDYLMGITHIIRGSEYLSSNPKYILLYQAFGWEVPCYIHLPLINGKNPDGTVSKLSKRHGAVSFQALVEDGYLPEAIINYIALLGWSPKNEREIFTMDELCEVFSVAGLHKSPAVFDYQKLDWVNAQHIQAMPFEKFSAMAFDYSGVKGTFLEQKWNKVATLMQPRINKFTEIPEKLKFLYEVAPYDVELYINKKNKSTLESSVEILKITIDAVNQIDKWDEETLSEAFGKVAADNNIKYGPLMWPSRIAMSGLLATPGGSTDIMYLIGKEETLKRLKAGLEFIQSKLD